MNNLYRKTKKEKQTRVDRGAHGGLADCTEFTTAAVSLTPPTFSCSLSSLHY